jgi:hypothetical protein
LTILLRPFGLHVPTTNLLSIRLTMIFQKRNTTGANGGTGTTYTSGAPVFTHVLVEFVLLNISFSVLYFVYHVCRFLSCILSTTYVVLSLFFWLLYCLFFFELCLLPITLLYLKTIIFATHSVNNKCILLLRNRTNFCH